AAGLLARTKFVVERFVTVPDRGKREFLNYSSPGRHTQISPLSCAGSYELPDCVGERLRVSRRHAEPGIADDVGAIANVGNHTGNAATHGFADRVGKAFRP